MLSALLMGLMRLLIFYCIRKRYIADLYQRNLVLNPNSILVLIGAVLFLFPFDEVERLGPLLRQALGHQD